MSPIERTQNSYIDQPSKLRANIQQIVVFAIFLVLIAATLTFPSTQSPEGTVIFASTLGLLTLLFAAGLYFTRKNPQKTTDLFLILGLILLVWDLATHFNLIDTYLFPTPESVFAVYSRDYPTIIAGIFSSLSIICTGYILALILAIPIGLVIGWRKRVYNVAYPIAKVASPIPPIVYMPYAIALLPTFFMSSTFLIFIGTFWPILVGVIYGVFSIDHRILNSAKTLGLDEITIMRKVLLPAAMPSIFSGALIGLILTFITLTAAEIVGASSGIGWYIQYQSGFANYDAVAAGMIVLAIIVIFFTVIFDKVQDYVLRWQKTT